MARKRELACLRTLGMSEKQLAMMIQGEGLYFALVNSVVTVIVGGICGYALVELAVYNGLNYLMYQFSLGYLVCYSLMEVIVPIGIACIVVKILAKKSLVDRLRENE